MVVGAEKLLETPKIGMFVINVLVKNIKNTKNMFSYWQWTFNRKWDVVPHAMSMQHTIRFQKSQLKKKMYFRIILSYFCSLFSIILHFLSWMIDVAAYFSIHFEQKWKRYHIHIQKHMFCRIMLEQCHYSKTNCKIVLYFQIKYIITCPCQI